MGRATDLHSGGGDSNETDFFKPRVRFPEIVFQKVCVCLYVCLYICLSVRFGPREQMFKVVKQPVYKKYRLNKASK